MAKTIIKNHKIGKLLVLKNLQEKDRFGNYLSLCLCTCGNIVKIPSTRIRNNYVKSCGSCTRAGEKATQNCWRHMILRCYDKEDPAYIHYGGRGIKVCEQWLIYNNFLRDMGNKPKELSLDRINNDGNYSKENCRWATRKEQANNRRTNHLIVFEGIKLTLAQWADFLHIDALVFHSRIMRGMNFVKAATTPYIKIKKSKQRRTINA